MKFLQKDELYSCIGENIKYYRNRAGLTQMQLAQKAQISISYLSKLEAAGCSKSVSISVLNHIASALEVDIREFFSIRKEKNHGKTSK